MVSLKTVKTSEPAGQAGGKTRPMNGNFGSPASPAFPPRPPNIRSTAVRGVSSDCYVLLRGPKTYAHLAKTDLIVKDRMVFGFANRRIVWYT